MKLQKNVLPNMNELPDKIVNGGANANEINEQISIKTDNSLLNLIAEIIVEIIVKRQKNGGYRIRKDK